MDIVCDIYVGLKKYMFLYMIDQRYGSDRVAFYGGAKDAGLYAGDLCMIDGNYGLCLGEHIGFEEKYSKIMRVLSPPDILIEKLLSKKTVQTLHDFVVHRFTTYKNAVPLFLSSTPEHLIKYRIRTKAKKQPQSLHIFPTLWALMQETTPQERAQGVVLTSSSTSVQKAKAFRGLKQGKITQLYCTYSQLFQDRSSLGSVILHDQHAWWYKNPQDPRYFVPTVVEHLTQETGAALDKTGHSLV